MELRNRINEIIRSVNDFNLLRRDKQWSGKDNQDRYRFNRLKMEYNRSRTDQDDLFMDDNFNTLKIRA